MFKNKHAFASVGLALALAWGPTAAHAGNYQLQLLSLPGWASSSGAMGINASGDVVGYAVADPLAPTGTSPSLRAMLWSQGSALDLGVLPGAHANAQSVGLGITSSGQVLGMSSHLPVLEEGGYDSPHSVLWHQGTVRDLSVAASGPNTSEIQFLRINDQGLAVGYHIAAEGMSNGVAASWSESGGLTLLGSEFSYGVARGVNNSGVIVGDDNGWATIWQNGVSTMLAGGLGGSANDINEGGLVVGTALDEQGLLRAALWDKDSLTLLNQLASEFSTLAGAAAVNERGQVVGYSERLGEGPAGMAAVLWQDGAAIDLNTQVDTFDGWRLVSANGINDAGQIIGEAMNAEGVRRAFVLTPTSIPEASTWASMSLGLALMCGVLRRQRGRAAPAPAVADTPVA
ncbi:MAG: DUF3466 family protein [Burkholderiales bacterium]|nr:DUF3466 family protein [Burkholderiales bacterium]MBH2017778.1 DUF3466 family protein [Burkholderiales bacterium]